MHRLAKLADQGEEHNKSSQDKSSQDKSSQEAADLQKVCQE